MYVKDPTMIGDVECITPLFGDHKLIMFCIDEPKDKIVTNRKDWRHYSKEILCTELSMINWSILELF